MQYNYHYKKLIFDSFNLLILVTTFRVQRFKDKSTTKIRNTLN